MTAQGELLLSLLAMHAEEQAKSASDNKRWQIKRYFEEGRPTYFRIYGYKWAKETLEIIPEEAQVVRRIFEMYLSGMGRTAIAKRLNSEGITINGCPWQEMSIFYILRNEKYTGDMLLQKWHTPDYRTKKRLPNRGQWRQYLVRECHEPIIDREMFEAAQLEIERRKRTFAPRGNAPLSSKEQPKLFTGLIKCKACGSAFYYKNKREKSSGKYIPLWMCRKYLELGKDYCSAKQIRESILIEKTREVLGLSQETEITRELILAHITAIESVVDNRLRFYLTDGRIETVTWENRSRRESWTPEMKQKVREKALARIKTRKEANHA